MACNCQHVLQWLLEWQVFCCCVTWSGTHVPRGSGSSSHRGVEGTILCLWMISRSTCGAGFASLMISASSSFWCTQTQRFSSWVSCCVAIQQLTLSCVVQGGSRGVAITSVVQSEYQVVRRHRKACVVVVHGAPAWNVSQACRRVELMNIVEQQMKVVQAGAALCATPSCSAVEVPVVQGPRDGKESRSKRV